MPTNSFAAFCLVLVSFSSISSLAQAPPSADAYVTSTQPSANFGSSALLLVQAGTTSYIRPNLGALPENAAVAKATLRLYVNAVASPGSFDVFQVDARWDEHGLNFNNAPLLGLSATGGRSVSVAASGTNQFLLIDITPLVQGWLNGSIPNNGLAVALTSPSGSFSFDSKESVGTGHQPELEVVFGSPENTAVGASTTMLPFPTASKTTGQTMPGSSTGSATERQTGFHSGTSAATSPATNFVDSTTDQVVQVQQNGTGMGLSANSPSDVGVLGTTNAGAIPGIVAGVEGITSLPTGYGIYARQTSPTAPLGVAPRGLYAQSDSPNGIGISGWASGSGGTIGLHGGASSTSGNAINATETATSGNTVGLVARVYSPAGIGALILNNSTSPITAALISARTNNGVRFAVDGAGNVNTVGGFTGGGTVSGVRLISTVANGTPPLQVSSTTLVPNLNVGLLGGSPASAFAPAVGSAGYIQNGSTLQTGAGFNVDGNGTVGGILSAAAMNSTNSYQIGGTVVLSVGAAADQNLFVGNGAGTNNTPGSGQDNTFAGYHAGLQNTTGSNNTFLGMYAGQPVITGRNNTFLGSNAGVLAGAASSNNVYISNQGMSADNGAIRIGDSANQTAAYLAGVNGSATSSGVPVFIDATGKLGTGGGSVDFAQVVGTLSSPQLSGTYSNAVTLANTNNIFNGTFTGNGSGLTGVSSGLSWPIVQKSTDYTIQTSDFSTPTKYGNFIVLVGTVTHTFTLPSQPPPNGSCVAIGDFAGAGINSGTNVYLSINTSGVGVDGGPTGTITQIRHQTYLICSDGSSYWRLGRQQTTPSQIGPWLYTQDTGAVNVLTTTYVNGLDGPVLGRGNMIYLLPKFANTSATPTLNVNGLGPKLITKFGTQPLAPGDLTTTALAHMIYDGVQWQLLNPQTNQGTVTSVTATAPLVSSGGATPVLSCPTCVTGTTLGGTTASIGGAALTAGTCTTGTATVTGATVGHPVSVSASDGTLPNGLIILSAAVTSPGTVTVQLCATASVTPAISTYNVVTQ